MSDADDTWAGVNARLREKRSALHLSAGGDCPVAFDKLSPEEKLRLEHIHRQGLPLDRLQRDMIGAVPDKHRARIADAEFFSPLGDPARFLEQISQTASVLKAVSWPGTLRGLAAKHNFHPEFQSRLATGTSSLSDRDLVLMQQKQTLPAFQARMFEMHGSPYLRWLQTKGLEISSKPLSVAAELQRLATVSIRPQKQNFIRRALGL